MRNGFTLIELLAVIIILSIIASITLYATGNIIKDSKQNLSEVQRSQLIEAARIFELSHQSSEYVCVQELIYRGYIEAEKVIDPKDRTEITGYIAINRSNKTTTFEYRNDDPSLCLNVDFPDEDDDDDDYYHVEIGR